MIPTVKLDTHTCGRLMDSSFMWFAEDEKLLESIAKRSCCRYSFKVLTFAPTQKKARKRIEDGSTYLLTSSSKTLRGTHSWTPQGTPEGQRRGSTKYLAIGFIKFIRIMNQIHYIHNQLNLNSQPILLYVVSNFIIWYPYSQLHIINFMNCITLFHKNRTSCISFS